MKKRFWSAVLAALMVVNLLPMSVLAEELTGEAAPVQEETVVRTEETLNAEGTCPHSSQAAMYKVTQSICADGCTAPKGTGELYYCPDCGEVRWISGWGGNTYGENDSIVFDFEKKTVSLRCDTCKAEKKYSLTTGEEITDEPEQHEHSWVVSEVIAPTCTQQGYKEYTCACGAERVDNYMPALGHSWDNGVVTAEPNCKQTGVKTYTCKTCNETKTETLGVNDMHQFTVEETPATCEADGFTKYTCSLCGYSYKVDIPGGHEWEEISRTDATCVAQGVVNYMCAVCYQTKQDTLPATGKHTWEEAGNTATCEENGYITYECRDCDAIRKTDVAALGHAWGEWAVDTEPTCKAAGVEKRICERGCVETRELPAVSHDYGQDYRCVYCDETYPEVQAILDAIDALPAVDEINERNALAVYNEVTDIIERMNAIEDGTNPDHKAALALYADQDAIRNVYEECLKYLIFTVYEEEVGEQSFEVFWNDNNERDYRTAMDQFLAASHAVLGYEIVSEDGSTVVASGVLTNAADVNAAFAFLGIDLPENAQLLTMELEAESYLIDTNPDLPVGYKSTYTDYTTGESYTSEFKIHYTLTLENPAEEHYVTTLPERTTGAVTMKDGEMVIFTKLTDWSASIVWYDDDNRSALGGASTAHRPRVDAETLKAATKVYYYPQGYNVRDGEPVVGDFGYVIDGDTITLTGLPAYDNDGNPLAYYISQRDIMAANADYVPGNRYTVDYMNVGNFSSKTNGVYDGGYLFETLYNTIPFTVTKVWADGRTPDERPDCKFYIWRITEDYNGNQLAIDPEFCYAIPNCYDYYDVPKEDSSTYEFIRDMGSGEYLRLFPMYDTEGRRYIYFGKESGLPGEYSSILDNSGAKVLDSVIAAFSQGTNAAYFLNGATITNTVGERTSIPVSKEFHALSLQNKLDADTPITATFLLQKKAADGSWVSANVERDGIVCPEADGVIIDQGNDGSLTVTLTKFAAEDMSASFGGVTVSQYDRDTHAAQEFRWVETGVSVNGVSAAYQPSDWVSDGNGAMHYEGDIIVYDGQTSTVLGDNTTRTSGADDTTAIFNAVASGSHFTNTLVGKHQVEIRKYFVDENGNNIAADAQKMAGVSVTFTIYRDDVEFDTVTMTIDDLSRGNDYWEKLLNYDRYDEEGREYHFKVKETAFGDQWTNRTEDYEVQVLEYPAGSDILVKRLLTVYVNGPGPGGLEFDVEKQWLDDSDLQTRNPVVAAVYRFRNADGSLLSSPVQVSSDITLSMSNNWYKKISVPANGQNDSTENYVILEKGILVDGTLVPTNYDFDFTSQKLKDMHDAFVGGQTYAGITGRTDREDSNWDGLYYRYKLFEKRADREESPALASYVLTNLRIGTQDYIVEKTWKAGGQIRKCSFGLFYEDQMIAEFTLDVVNDRAQLSNVDWKNGYNHSNIDIEATSAGIDNNGNYEASVKISGLAKFDDVGAQQEYSIQEIAIYGKDGVRYNVTNGGCQAGEETYAVSVDTSLERADNDNHRAPDLYTVAVTNTLVGRYDLVSNKVWRDANQIVRPDVCFSVYRMSTQDATLSELVTSGDTDAMSEYLAAHTASDYRVITDRYWNTHINSYWWTCTVENMQQYDDNGYPYVYYAVEKISSNHVGEGSADGMSTSALYVGYYCNDVEGQGYRPVNPQVASGSKLTTKQVFGVENDELCPTDGNVFILADGINKASNGEYKDYYSATAVNRPERERTVSGKKLWKLPHGWAVSSAEMPEVSIDLYRSTDEISFSSYDTAVAYANAIKNAAEGGVLDTAVVNNENNYAYSFTVDANENPLPRYDKWGSTYYYYTLEKTQWEDGITRQNFPENAVVYEDNDFNINNIFSSEPPYVEVSVEKIWELSADVLAKLSEYGLTAITTDDFAPATINLYGVPTDSQQAEIDKAHFDFGSVTLTPGVTDSDGDGTDDTVYTVNGKKLTATYTFKTFYNDETEQTERLPYYWLHNYVINYYLDETHNDGYQEVYSNTKVSFNGNRSEGDLLIRFNTDKFQLKNTYTGVDTTEIDFNFSKVWNDKYVGNDDYRPNEVTFTIKRSLGGEVDDGFVKTVTLRKSDFAGEDTWTGSLSGLLKYAPSGEEYVYFVDSEKVGENVADAVSEEVGNYVLTSKSNDRLINTLNENLRVTLQAGKTWTVDGAAVSSYTNGSYTGFDDLRDMGVIPDTIQFVVQRKVEGGSYGYVSASDYLDSVHKISVDNQTVVGHEVNLKDADADNYSMMLNAAMKWENLPKYDTDGNLYIYRVIEILYWHDGTTDTVLASGSLSRGMTASIEPGTEANVFQLTNDLLTEKVRLAKIWMDENGDENTRPAQIDVKVDPVGTASGRVFTLTTTGNAMDKADANVYYSAYFHIPKGIAKTYGMTGEKYTITESFKALNGAVYTQTVTSDGGNVVAMADGTYALQLTNTYDNPGRKTLNLEATKNWSSDGDWKDVTRPDISFKIQYYNRDTKAWTDITDMSAFSKDTDQAATKTVPTDTGKVTWTNMYKYWHPVKVDGKAEFIRYRVVEVVNTDSGNSSYSKNSPEFTGIKDNTATAKATLTNNMQTVTVKVNKSWTKNGDVSDKLTVDEAKNLVALNAIPNELTFVIEYQLAGSSAWTTIPNGTVTYTAEQLLQTQDTGKKLPRYDKDGNEITYRVRETNVKYLNGSSYDVTWSGSTGEIGSISTTPESITYAAPTAAMVNDYRYVSLAISKIWVDEGNRDGLRGDISVTLYRDGGSYSVVSTADGNVSQTDSFCSVSKIGDNWALSWDYLPMYQADKVPSDDTMSVYTWEETRSIDGYGATYDKDGADRSEAENGYQPMRGTVVAAKVWSDNSNKFYSMPDEIYLKLQYQIGNGTWKDVTKNTLEEINDRQYYEDASASEVYTTSDDGWRTATADDNWSLSWVNLPVKALNGSTSTTVKYRVVEGVKGADGGITAVANNGKLNGYTVTYSTVSLSGNGDSKTSTVTNTLDTTSLQVIKSWAGDSAYTDKVRPQSVTFNVEWKKGSGSWSAIPDGVSDKLTIADGKSTVTVTANGNWCETVSGLPKADADGTAYQYRITEAKVTYANGDVTVNNQMAGPYNVTDVTVNATLSDGVYTATATNSLLTGKLSVTKDWVDDNDRDGGRQSITVELYRDGEKFDEKTVTANDNWTAEFTNLPVYQNTASGATTAEIKSVYTVKEKGEQNGSYTGRNNIAYTVAYSEGVTLEQAADATTAGYAAEATITNTHQVFEGSLTVGKIWNDSENKFSSRPANITLTLQYQAADGSWVDVSATDAAVYTDSTNPGIISNTTASYTWNGLPVNLSGHSITYRVVESTVSGYRTAVYQPATVQLAKSDETYAGNITVTNELDTTSLTIRKSWESVSYLTPVSAEFKVEYSHDNGRSWQTYGNVTVNYAADATTAGGQTVVSGLPKTDGQGNTYTYRVSEVSTTYYVGDTSIPSTANGGSFDENGTWSGNIGVYSATVSGVTNNDGSFTFTADNEVIKGSLSVTKNWDDDNDRDAGRQSVTVELYRDGVKFDEKTLSADKEWTATFTNLPVYQNTSSSAMPAKSVYTLKELGLNEDGQYVGNNDRLYEVSYVDGVSLNVNDDGTYSADASLTNTHEPLSFSVKAMKAWEDTKDYGIRPDVQLELRWATSTDATDWTPVEQSATAPKGGDGKTVTTTSPVRQTLKNEDQTVGTTWGSAQWNDLPAYVIAVVDGVETSVPVYYKAFEVGDIPEVYESAESAATSYANAQGDDMIATVQVVNTLVGKMSVTVQKSWLDDDEQYNAHADSITVKLQYVTSDTDTAWKDIPVDATQVLSAESTIPWSYTWENLRNDYSYRVIELDMTFDGVTLKTLPAGGTEGEIGGYTYTAETTVNADGTLTQCDITNELIVGEIEVTKTWEDSHDRDGMRPETLTFQLYRDDGTEPIATLQANVTADGIEKCVFENIPVYQEGTRELSSYYVVETDEEGYSITYDVTVDSAVTLCDAVNDETAVTDQTTLVTNRHETILFRVEATKTWDDANDPYGLRPTEVSVKLQYAFDPESEDWTDVTVVTAVPDPAEDDGTLVFTTSELIQTLTREDLLEEDGDVWGTAAWENLPAYALMPVTDGEYVSAPVYYRVVETESVAASYGSYATDPMCYEDAEGETVTASGTVLNPLEDRTELEVTKKWVGGRANVQIVAQLQYRVDADSPWAPVPKNAEVMLSKDNDWTHTFTDLRADYEYRCVELGMLYSYGKIIEVRQLRDKDTTVFGFLPGYSATSTTTTATDELGHTYYVSRLTNRYIPEDEELKGPKTGDTFNGLLYSTAALTSAVGIVVLGTKRKKKENA